MVSPFAVAEYCGSFKVFRSEGLQPIGIKNVVTIISLINILDDGRGVYCARYVRHSPQYSEGYIHHWDLDDSIILLDSSVVDEDGILYSAEDLSEEVDDDDIEILAEVVTLDERLALPEEDIVAGPSMVSNKRKAENTVFVFSNKKPRINFV